MFGCARLAYARRRTVACLSAVRTRKPERHDSTDVGGAATLSACLSVPLHPLWGVCAYGLDSGWDARPQRFVPVSADIVSCYSCSGCICWSFGGGDRPTIIQEYSISEKVFLWPRLGGFVWDSYSSMRRPSLVKSEVREVEREPMRSLLRPPRGRRLLCLGHPCVRHVRGNSMAPPLGQASICRVGSLSFPLLCSSGRGSKGVCARHMNLQLRR